MTLIDCNNNIVKPNDVLLKININTGETIEFKLIGSILYRLDNNLNPITTGFDMIKVDNSVTLIHNPELKWKLK